MERRWRGERREETEEDRKKMISDLNFMNWRRAREMIIF